MQINEPFSAAETERTKVLQRIKNHQLILYVRRNVTNYTSTLYYVTFYGKYNRC